MGRAWAPGHRQAQGLGLGSPGRGAPLQWAPKEARGAGRAQTFLARFQSGQKRASQRPPPQIKMKPRPSRGREEEDLAEERPARPAKRGGGPGGGGPAPPRSGPEPRRREPGPVLRSPGRWGRRSWACGARRRWPDPRPRTWTWTWPAGATASTPPPPPNVRLAPRRDRGLGRGRSRPQRASRAAGTDPSDRRRRRSPKSLVHRPNPSPQPLRRL